MYIRRVDAASGSFYVVVEYVYVQYSVQDRYGVLRGVDLFSEV